MVQLELPAEVQGTSNIIVQPCRVLDETVVVERKISCLGEICWLTNIFCLVNVDIWHPYLLSHVWVKADVRAKTIIRLEEAVNRVYPAVSPVESEGGFQTNQLFWLRHS